MKLNKKQGQFLTSTINHWLENAVISTEEADRLKGSYSIRAFDWKKLAAYCFYIAIACGIIAFGSLVLDEWLISLIEQLLLSSDTAICLLLALVAVGFYYWGFRRRLARPEKVFSNEAILFVGVLFTAGSIGYFGKAVDTGSGHFSLLFLLSTAIYAGLAFWSDSRLIWIFAVLSFGIWFGTETGYFSGWVAYFLGMNYPMRFVVFGMLLIALSFLLKAQPRFADFFQSTYSMGLLYLFVALWLLSIFGNYGDIGSWYRASSMELFHWGLLFALAAIGAIVYGLRQDDRTSRGYGITFLFINLYTKYFEFFWDSTHKALFFGLMAISFWWIGSKAESIWNLEFLKPEEKDTHPSE